SRLPLGCFRHPFGLGYLAALLTLSVVTPFVFVPDLAIPVVPARLPANAQEAHGPAIARFANGIDLLAVSAPATLTAGQTLPITLHWRVERTPPDNAIAYVHLVGPAGRRLAGSDAIPLEKTYAPTLWQAGEIVDERRSLAAPSQLTPGNYRLDVGLYHLDPTGTRITPVPLEPAGPPDEAATAVRWQILPDASGLASATPISASFGPRLTLLADRVDVSGSSASAHLYWKATAPISRRLVVSVQALDARGRLVAQNDSEPVSGLLSTTTWRPGDVIADDHPIQLPAGADPPSRYIVAVYDRQTLARLGVAESGRPAGDHVTLAVTPAARRALNPDEGS
ncbi:MAG TPA: hypothetical protein VKW77_08000, partial [Acidimicrobiales bacterium]|nr:hypothetical protein [Acidimicrobiales bacterium]